MSKIRDLRIEARRRGIADARSMSEEELEAALAEAKGSSNGAKSQTRSVRKAVTKVVKKRPRAVEPDEDEIEDVDEDEVEEVPKRRRGRPKGSTTKKRGKPAKATATRSKPGRPPKATKASETRSVRKAGKVGRPKGSGTGTRIPVPDELDWDVDFDFREGSSLQYILTQLRKSANKYDSVRDIRADAVEKLEPKLNKAEELTFMNRATGKPHKGEIARQRLVYMVAKTVFDYANATGQMKGASKRSAKASTPVKKRGRPAKAETKTTTRKATRGRPAKKAATGKKRGRPSKKEALKAKLLAQLEALEEE